MLKSVVIPPHLQSVCDAIMPLVETYKRKLKNRSPVRASSPEPILNAQFGCMGGKTDVGGGDWVQGVSRPEFEATLGMFLAYNQWVRMDKTWVDVHEYVYPIQSKSGPSVAGEQPPTTTTTLVTTRVTLGDQYHVHHTKTEEGAFVEVVVDGRGCARIQTSAEECVTVKALPSVVLPQKVCLRKRRSFYTKSWRFDLTMSWVAESRTGAENAQRNDEDAVYDISITFQPCADGLSSTTYISVSLVLKLTDIMVGNSNVACHVVQTAEGQASHTTHQT